MRNVLRPSAGWVWRWDWAWVTQGRRLDHPSVTPGSRLGHAWVEWRKCLCLQQRLEKAGWGLGAREGAYRRDRTRSAPLLHTQKSRLAAGSLHNVSGMFFALANCQLLIASCCSTDIFPADRALDWSWRPARRAVCGIPALQRPARSMGRSTRPASRPGGARCPAARSCHKR